MILSIQLYSLREFMSFNEMLHFCKGKGFSCVEPAGLYDMSADEVVSQLKDLGLKAKSFHFSLQILQEYWEELGHKLPECGTSDLVMPFANANSLEEVKVLAADLQNIAEKLKGLGIKLHYHNHAHEISKIFDGKCFIDWLLDLAPDLNWQVDCGWVAAGGANVPAKMDQWKDRISMLHIKDILYTDKEGPVATKMENGVEVVVSSAALKGGQPAAIGDGIVDFPGIFTKAKKLGIDTFILENDNPEDVEIFVDSGIALVKKNMGGT